MGEHASRVVSFFSTVRTFGTAADVTLAEPAIEAFFPADEETDEFRARRVGRVLAQQQSSRS
jgi:hypothetical protein